MTLTLGSPPFHRIVLPLQSLSESTSLESSAAAEVHLICLKDLQPPQIESMKQISSEERRARTDKLLWPEDQERSWVAGFLEKHAIENFPESQFSLSHSGEWVGCALTKNPQIGFDLESHEAFQWDLLDIQAVAEKFIPIPKESSHWHQTLPEIKTWFLREWTLREAWAKALKISLDDILTPHFEAPKALLQVTQEFKNCIFSVYSL